MKDVEWSLWMIRVKGAGFIIQDIRVPVIRVPGRVCNAVR
jgi:hypothetical protein